MKAKLMVSALALVGGIALAVPVFAQQAQQDQPGQMGQPNTQMDRAQNQPGQMPSGASQAPDQRGMGMQDQAQNDDMSGGQGRARHHRRHAMRRHHHGEMAMRGREAGRYGMDVAPGGGTYSRGDVAIEAADRMSHPVVGERRAPSNVAQGSLAHVDQAENADTARLNQQQLGGNAPGMNQ